ncbi:hypothetical protein BDW74DRAFT_165147 [Aspergillus multicolor]|uniref:putative short-chain dehydrogenase/reductase n=1 Tax=Aspergillus multicolor TaxID=41759 RepID=UPI003CCCAD93
MPSSNRYAAAHANPHGPGDDRPTALQIIRDENLSGALRNKIVLITGTSSGIGLETPRVMAATGARVFCAARNVDKNRAALSNIAGDVKTLELDLASFTGIRHAAAEFLSRSGGRLHILINNADVMVLPERCVTRDGVEMQFGVNHLGHFLLFQMLKDAMLDSASEDPEFPYRVVNVSSSGHRMSGIHVGSYNLDAVSGEHAYTPFKAYGESKTANIYMALKIERLYGSRRVHGFAVSPENVYTEVQRHLDSGWMERYEIDEQKRKSFKSVEQGAATTVYAAVSQEFMGRGAISGHGYARHAFNKELEERLWMDSCRMIGVVEEGNEWCI